MTCRTSLSVVLGLSALLSFAGCSRRTLADNPTTVDELAITVTGPSREVAFTNKEAGFFYTETNGDYRSSAIPGRHSHQEPYHGGRQRLLKV